MGLIDNALQRLTSKYNKNSDSNIAKLIEVVTDEIQLLKNSKDDIKAIRDIDQAYGEHLDRIGKNLQQERGQLNDSVYTLLLKGKVARNLADGTINNIIDILNTMLDIENNEVTINRWPNDEPASLYIEIPLSPISDAGMTRQQFLAILHRIVVAGVRPYTTLNGTLEFSDEADGIIYSSEEGLSNEDRTTGGYLGGFYEPVESPPLPGWE